jgi:hypothetical protein
LIPDLIPQEETMPNPKHRPPLRLAEPAPAVPDWRASVARALLDRYVPVDSLRSDQALTVLDPDGGGAENWDALQNDPRYLIGRLQQALTALLQADVPAMDATAQLLGDAISDAIHYRRRTCPRCPDGSVCAKCWQDNWRQANAYEALWSELGIIGEPERKPDLRVAGDGK